MHDHFDGEENRNSIRERWNSWSDSWFHKRATSSIIEQIRDRPEAVFHETVFEDIQKVLQAGDINKVCVLGSGDNQAAFAFHFLGMEVTSVDISEQQIDNARQISESHGIEINFLVSDILNLRDIGNEAFDMIYTSNGVLTWIDDLPQMFNEAKRILRKGGVYVLYDVHPFQRPWKDDLSSTVLEKPYEEVGPHLDAQNENATFHWRIEDIINALSNAHFSIKWLHELNSGNTKNSGYFWGDEVVSALNDWRTNPLAGMPSWIEIVSTRGA